MNNHICGLCGIKYASYNHQSKYCSIKCRGISQQKTVNEPEIVQLYYLGYTQNEVARMMNTTQKIIFNVLKRNGIKSRPAIKRNQLRENNSSWKGGIAFDEKGYKLIKCCDHPRARGEGNYIPEHILIIEAHLNKELVWKGPGHPESEIVHHLNGNKQDNRIENLKVVSFIQHMEIHNKLRKEGGRNVGNA